MEKLVVALAVAGALGWSAAPALQPASPPPCLHGPSSAPDNTARRDAAVQYARQLNTFEAAGRNQAQRYYAIEDLPGLPTLPEGFKARMSTDGASYAFSVKDTLDPCHFALFSDQDGLIYTATPIQ
jgi:hypothetical protein